MARTTKKIPKAKKSAKKPVKKKSLLQTLKAMVPGQKGSKSRATKNVKLKAKFTPKANAKKTSPNPEVIADKAHAPGHRRMNLKGDGKNASGAKNIPQNASAMNRADSKDNIARHAASNRRIISGAALGKTGRMS